MRILKWDFNIILLYYQCILENFRLVTVTLILNILNTINRDKSFSFVPLIYIMTLRGSNIGTIEKYPKKVQLINFITFCILVRTYIKEKLKSTNRKKK